MRLAEHVPGQRLRLDRAESPSRARAAIVAILFAPPILGPLLLMGSLTPDGKTPTTWTLHLFAVLAMAAWYGGVLTLAWLLLRDLDLVRSLTVDRSEGEVRIVREFLWSRREVRLPIASLEGVEIDSSSRMLGFDLGVPTRIVWRLGGLRSRSTLLAAPFADEDARTSLLRSLAAILGLRAWNVERNDALGYRAVASGGLEEGMTPLDAAPGAGADPIRFRGPFRIATWSPGREVRFDRLIQVEILGVEIGASLFLLLLAVTFLMIAGERDGWTRGVFGLLGLGVVAFCGWGAWRALHDLLPRRCILDWGQRTIRVEALRSEQMDFSEIASIQVREEKQVVRDHRRRDRTLHRAQAIALSIPTEGRPARGLLLVETEWSRMGPSGPRDEVTRIATHLAESLGVPVVGGA